MVVDTLRGFSFGQVAFIIGQLAKIPRRLASELAEKVSKLISDVSNLTNEDRWRVRRWVTFGCGDWVPSVVIFASKCRSTETKDTDNGNVKGIIH